MTENQIDSAFSLPLREVRSLTPFTHTLDYNAPARGVWNIVHIGMLLPESHQVFFCPESCMRGVVLTAVEMGAARRFSSILMEPDDMMTGGCEETVIENVSELLARLPRRPKAVLLYTSCVDRFMGLDHSLIYGTLREKFPDIAFVECFMCPTMRKSSLPPDPLLRKNLFSLLEPCSKKRRAVNFIGNNRTLPPQNEFVRLIHDAGYDIMDISACKTFDEYLKMSESKFNILINPQGFMAADDLETRLGQPAVRIPVSYRFDEITRDFNLLASALGVKAADTSALRQKASEALINAAKKVGNRPVAVDYMATSRPFGLARLLLEHGFRVEEIFADFCSEADAEDLRFLRKNAGQIRWRFPYNPQNAVLPKENEDFLAIGQDAAYFTGTKHFVNMVESDGLYGYDGIIRLAAFIEDAAANEKDTRSVIQIKGLDCKA